jgi:hypothetical protein
MDTKLTLKLEQTIIEKAKKYARNNETSISKLLENYLMKITSDQDVKIEITPLVRSLSGIIELSEDSDERTEYSAYLEKKYQ